MQEGQWDRGDTEHTYEVPALRQIILVQGWQSVYWDAERQEHELYSIEALGLGYSNTHQRHGHGVIKNYGDFDKKEDWTIYALEYRYGEGWVIVDNNPNFCGLLLPDGTLETFESQSSCHLSHKLPSP